MAWRGAVIAGLFLSSVLTASAQEAQIVVDATECRLGLCVPVEFHGNGVYVARNGDNSASIVATAAHVVTAEAGGKLRGIRVDQTPATILGRWLEPDGGVDLALLRVSGPAPKLATHATEIPPRGAEVWLRGYLAGQRVTNRGVLLDTERRLADYHSADGLSGAGVFDTAGRLLGVHRGKQEHGGGIVQRQFTSLRRLDQFLAQYAPDMKSGRTLAGAWKPAGSSQPSQPIVAKAGVEQPAPTNGDTAAAASQADNTPSSTAGTGPATTDAGSTGQDAATTDGGGASSAGTVKDTVVAAGKAAVDVAKDVAAGTAEGVADSAGPGAIGAFMSGGWPALGLYVAGHAAYAIVQRRRKRRQSGDGQPATEDTDQRAITQDAATQAAETADPRLDMLQAAVAALTERLNEDRQDVKSSPDIELEKTITQQQPATGLQLEDVLEYLRSEAAKQADVVVAPCVGDDGQIETGYWAQGVRLLKEGKISTLGGKWAADALERWVYDQQARDNHQHLTGGNPNGS